MKRFGWILPLLLLFGLLAFPSAAFTAASDAALLWWTRVLPSLLPYLIAASLLLRSGVFWRVRKRLLPFALFLFGAIGGYPVGAKLAAQLYRDGVLSQSDAQAAAIACNLPNPVFLLSVVAIGFFGDVRTALPLLIGVYGAALLFAFPLLRLPYRRTADSAFGLSPNDLTESIWDGVRTIGVIGGCLVFASVLGALLSLPFADSSVTSVCIGLLEMTCGVRAASVLPLSLRWRLAVCAFLVQFGGLSILLQTNAQFPIRPLRYLAKKLLTALLAALLTYALTPLLCPDAIVPTFANAAELRQNAFALFSVSLSASIGLLFIFVFTVGLSRHRKTRTPKNTGI